MADRVESVSRGTGGFVCSISGSAAPVRRGCGCVQVHSSTRQALARGLHSFAPSAAHRRPRHADAQRDSPLRRRSRKRTAAIATTRTACARAPPPQGASAKEPVTIRQHRDGPNGSGFALPTHASFGVSSFDRSCRERGTAHTGGFASVFVGPAVPMKRLWVQSSAYHATGRPCARPTGVRSFNFSSSTVGDVKARVAAATLSHALGGS